MTSGFTLIFAQRGTVRMAKSSSRCNALRYQRTGTRYRKAPHG